MVGRLRFGITVLLIPFFCLGVTTVQGQVRPGIKFGVSTPDIAPHDFLVTDPSGEDYYRVFVENARYGVHGGLFIQMQMGGFFIQPEILYNSASTRYRIDSLFSPGSGAHLFTENYSQIDFPIMLGLKSGAIRLGVGPVGHIFLDAAGEFEDHNNGRDQFEAIFDDITWGWQGGLGLDFWKLHIDIRYEGNFRQFGEQITFFGKRFDFSTADNRMIASLGFSF